MSNLITRNSGNLRQVGEMSKLLCQIDRKKNNTVPASFAQPSFYTCSVINFSLCSFFTISFFPVAGFRFFTICCFFLPSCPRYRVLCLKYSSISVSFFLCVSGRKTNVYTIPTMHTEAKKNWIPARLGLGLSSSAMLKTSSKGWYNWTEANISKLAML